jgi:hypothetical protein
MGRCRSTARADAWSTDPASTTNAASPRRGLKVIEHRIFRRVTLAFEACATKAS